MSRVLEAVINHETGLAALSGCPMCKGQNMLILDVLQITAAGKRWQWREWGAGANYCPCSWPEGRQETAPAPTHGRRE